MLNALYLFCFVCIGIIFGQNEQRSIKLKVIKKDKNNVYIAHDIRAKENEPLNIILWKPETIDANCYRFNLPHDKFNINHIYNIDTNTSIIQIPRVTKAMNTKWFCIILHDSGIWRTEFKLNVMPADKGVPRDDKQDNVTNGPITPKPNEDINNTKQYLNISIGDTNFMRRINSTTCDDISYFYEDGQNVNVTCQYPNNFILLSYNTLEGTSINVTNYTFVTFSKRMTAHDDGYWINCALMFEDKECRVIFKQNQGVNYITVCLSVLAVVLIVVAACVIYRRYIKAKIDKNQNINIELSDVDSSVPHNIIVEGNQVPERNSPHVYEEVHDQYEYDYVGSTYDPKSVPKLQVKQQNQMLVYDVPKE